MKLKFFITALFCVSCFAQTLTNWNFNSDKWQNQYDISTVNASYEQIVEQSDNRFIRHKSKEDNSWNSIQMTEGITVQPDNIYFLGLKYRNMLKEGQAQFGIRQVDAQDKTVSYSWKLIDEKKEWTQDSICVTPISNTVKIQIYMQLKPGVSGYVDWDDIELKSYNFSKWEKRKDGFIDVSAPEQFVFEISNKEETILIVPVMANLSAIEAEIRVEVKDYFNQQSIWANTSKIVTTGWIPFEIPVKKLPIGNYSLNIEAASPDRTNFFSKSYPIQVCNKLNLQKELEPVKTSSIIDGYLCVNNKRFLSLMMYHSHMNSEAIRDLKTMYGITTAQTWADKEPESLKKNVDMVWEQGVYSWAALYTHQFLDMKNGKWDIELVIEAVDSLKNHPGLIGWKVIDEPDGLGITREEVEKVCKIIKERDKNRVIWINLCLESKFDEYVHLSDIASFDNYPLPTSLEPVARMNSLIRDIAGPEKPLLSILQTYAPGAGRLPSPKELRAEMYMNICQGNTLFAFYAWWDPEPLHCLERSLVLKSTTRSLCSEIYELEPSLLSNALDYTSSELDKNNLKYTLRKNGNEHLLIVVNWTAIDMGEVAFKLPKQMENNINTVFENNRIISLKDNIITDSFSPYQVHIYKSIN